MEKSKVATNNHPITKALLMAAGKGTRIQP